MKEQYKLEVDFILFHSIYKKIIQILKEK